MGKNIDISSVSAADLLAFLKGRPDLLAGVLADLNKAGGRDALVVPQPSEGDDLEDVTEFEEFEGGERAERGAVPAVKEGAVKVIAAPPPPQEPTAPVKVEQAAPVLPEEKAVTMVVDPPPSERSVAPPPSEEVAVSVASEEEAAPVIVAPPPSEEPVVVPTGEGAAVSVASEEGAAPVIVAPHPSEEPVAPATSEVAAAPVVPDEEEAAMAAADSPSSQQPASPQPDEKAAAPVVPDEEEAAMAAADSQPPQVAAPAAPKPFKITSTCCTNDFITLDATTSGSVDLGTGRDAVALPGNKVDYKVARQDGGWTVSHDVDGAKVTINLQGVEWLQFDDGVVCLDTTDSHAITGYQIVKAVLGIPRDLNRVFSVAADIDHGKSQEGIIRDLMHVMQSQFKGRFSAPHDTQDGITQHFENILGREPDACGLTAWLRVAPHMTPERMLSSFALGPEATSAAVTEVGQGAPFEPTLFV